MPDYVSIASLVAASIAAVFAILAFIVARRGASTAPLSREDALEMFRREGDFVRTGVDNSARTTRQEIGQTLSSQQRTTLDTLLKTSDSLLQRVDAFGERLKGSLATTEGRIDQIGVKLNADIEQMGQDASANRDSLRGIVEQKLEHSIATHADAARDLREELNNSFQRMKDGVAQTLVHTNDQQKERLDATHKALATLSEKHTEVGEQLRNTLEGRLDLLRVENSAELEKVRATVDEKLNTTLNQRLEENFGRVVEQLNKAYEVFGEMKNISAHVGELKNVLTNPKLRGTFGEVQLAMLLQDFLAPSQYVKDAQVRENSAERVEYAIRLPLADGEDMLLPVDAKFPREDHEHMIAALEKGDAVLADHFRKQLENRIKFFAKDICKKYICPPRTTERAILFLPTESLFAEVLRIPGLFDHVQRECNVILAGPTTFAAILHAFQVNHRSMAIARQSSEVWKVLSAVRTEFQKYNVSVGKVLKQLNTATGSVAELDKRTRQMDRALKDVEKMPDDGSSGKLLGLDGNLADLDDDEALTFPAIAAPSASGVADLKLTAAE